MHKFKIITIDGASGVGKGTLAKALAKHLNYKLLDSGAIYRLAALHCNKNNTVIENESKVYEKLKNLNIKFKVEENIAKAFLNNEDVTKEIRSEQTGMLASKIATYPSVRSILLDKQREFACNKGLGLIADGRDMGTVVFTDAQYKFFLISDTKVTAKRRYKELKLQGLNPNFEKILTDIKKRDLQDSNRNIAPLRPSNNAIILDTSNLSIKEVFQKVISKISYTY